MSRPVRAALGLLLVLGASACTPPPAPGGPTEAATGPTEVDRGATEIRLRLLGDQNLDPEVLGDDSLGGLSGIIHDGDHWLALSDGRGEHGPARIHRMGIRVDDDGRLEVSLLGRLLLTGVDHPARFDPEALSRHGEDLLVASEGDGEEPRLPPGIDVFDAAGRWQRRLELPSRFVPPPRGPQGHGPRTNRGFEGLATLSDGSVVAAMEGALLQDGPRGARGVAVSVRFVRYDAQLRYAGEVHYRTDPAPATDGDCDVGVSDLAALDDHRLLVLERATVEERGRFRNRIRIYEIDLAGAEDARDRDVLSETPAVDKRLVLDFDDVAGELDPPRLDNFEAIGVGPSPRPGERLLLAVSDDNFSPSQRTALVAFALVE